VSANKNNSLDNKSVSSQPDKKSAWIYHVLQFIKFGIVGAICYVVDVGLYNVLVFAPTINFLSHAPVTAKAVSTAISTLLSWALNRNWAFREHKTDSKRKELVAYILINALGMLIAMSCLGFSRYILHLKGAISDNIFGNVIGTGLGTFWRYFAYKFILYKKK
jgi:putative flippase GtrA